MDRALARSKAVEVSASVGTRHPTQRREFLNSFATTHLVRDREGQGFVENREGQGLIANHPDSVEAVAIAIPALGW